MFYYLIGDSGYALRKNLMTPILNAEEGSPEGYYYSKHVSARNVVERTIGLLKARFRLVPNTYNYNRYSSSSYHGALELRIKKKIINIIY